MKYIDEDLKQDASHPPSSPSALEVQISRLEIQCDKERQQRKHKCRAAPEILSRSSYG